MASNLIVAYFALFLNIIGTFGSEAAKKWGKSQNKDPIDRERTLNNMETSCLCGENMYRKLDIEARILGGSPSKRAGYPWMAALCRSGSCKDESLLCGGSLINDRYVLTTAHCLKGINREELTVVLGQNQIFPDSLQPNSVYKVEQLIRHPDYNPKNYVSNIALIKLKTKVKVSSSINPICLPTKGECYLRANASLAGWGDVTGHREYQGGLKEVSFTIISREACQNVYYLYPGAIDKSMMCGWSFGVNGCEGDSGGPLMLKNSCGYYEQIGIAMGGVECTNRKYPAIFVKISKFLGFIHSNTQDANYCSYPDYD